MDQQQSAMLAEAEDEDSASMYECGSQAEASDDALTLSSHSDQRHRPEDAELPEEELVAPVVSLLKRAVSLDFENRHFADDNSDGAEVDKQMAVPPPEINEPIVGGLTHDDEDDYIVPLSQFSKQNPSLEETEDDEESFIDGDSQQGPAVDYLSLSSDEDNLEPRRHRPEHAELPSQELQVPVVSLLRRGTSLDLERREIIQAKLPAGNSDHGSKGAKKKAMKKKRVRRQHRASLESSADEDDDDDEDSFMEGDINQQPIMRQLSVSSDEFEPRRHRPEHAELPQADLAVPVVSLLKRSTSLDVENPDFQESSSIARRKHATPHQPEHQRHPPLPEDSSSEFEDEESFIDGDSQQEPMMQELSVSSDEGEPRRHRPEHAELPQQVLFSPVASTLNRRTSLDLELRDVLGAAGGEILKAAGEVDDEKEVAANINKMPQMKKEPKDVAVGSADEDSFCDGDSNDAALENLSVSTISDEPRRHHPEDAELPQDDQSNELTSSSRHRSATLDFENHYGSDSSQKDE